MARSSRTRRLHRRSPGRRRFLRTLPLAVSGGVALPTLTESTQTTAGRITDAIASAEALTGLSFTAEDRDAMAPLVTRNVDQYGKLRSVPIEQSIDPPVGFQPFLPGRRPLPGATPGAPQPTTRSTSPTAVASLDDLAFQPVTVLSNLLARRDVTSTALTRMYLARLKRFGPSLNCVVTLTEDLALEQAAAADRDLAMGRHRGPLHGIPWGLKDLFATRGIRTTWGAQPFEHQIIDVDATVVERLRDAGAVLVAKLSPGALARGGAWFGGTVKNPWIPERAVNASSAGPGAATAAGLVPFALCSETRGSIISTATPCGVTGLRPTFGRISRYGAMIASWSIDKVGMMCRSVEDCAHVLNVIYGPDGRDPSVVDTPFRWTPNASLAGLRLGYVRDEFEKPPSIASADERKSWPAWRPLWQAALDALRAGGAILEPIELPAFPAETLLLIQEAESSAAFDELTRSREVDRVPTSGTPASFRAARFIPAVEYLRAQRARVLLMREMDHLMTRWDAFLSPPRSDSLTITSFTGHSALVVTAGFADGIPISLMVTGRLFDEAMVLRVGLAFERATPWHAMRPTLG